MPNPKTGRSSKFPTRLFAVVVIYKMRPSDSPTLQTLLEASAQVPNDRLDLKVLVWDNTPGGQDVGELSMKVLYQPAPDNPGLARAYNFALDLAHTNGYEWLLTLDQDSILPANFLARITDLAQDLGPIPTIGAIVPQVTGDGRNLSPFQFAWGALPRWFPYGFVGTPKNATYAINSASTLRVTSLLQLAGYDPMFPLDSSDLNLFHRLQASGIRVFVAGDLVVIHEMSLLKKQGRMRKERYNALLLDEGAFWDMNMGLLARAERILRLAGRICKDLLSGEESAFRKRTISELKRRLLTNRRQRIMEWRRWAAARYAVAAQSPSDRLDSESSANKVPGYPGAVH